MTAYLVRMIVCSGLFYLGYRFFLEKLSNKRFNRFYLLASLIIPVCLPFFEFSINAEPAMVPAFAEYPVDYTSELSSFQISNIKDSSSIKGIDIFFWFYVIISGLLLIRMVVNLIKLIRAVKNALAVKYLGTDLNVIDGNTSPFSFLNKIYVSRACYQSGKITKEIIEHELTHVRQRHSLDILFFELIQAIAWINPFMIFFGKSIRLNHEFLADGEVARKTDDIRTYQYLLIGLYGQPLSPGLASSLHYSLTKKRLIMMTRKTSKLKALLHQAALVPVIMIAVILSCLKIQAQVTPPPVSKNKPDSGKGSMARILSRTPSTKEGVSQADLDTYSAELDKYKMANGRYSFKDLSRADREKLEKIFYGMSRTQQLGQTVHFVPESNIPMAKQTPTEKQFNNWKNSGVYGVWLDNKRIKNSELEKFKREETVLFNVSKLSPNAINYGKHYYQVTLMTENEYEAYATRTRAATGSYILYSSGRKP